MRSKNEMIKYNFEVKKIIINDNIRSGRDRLLSAAFMLLNIIIFAFILNGIANFSCSSAAFVLKLDDAVHCTAFQ